MALWGMIFRQSEAANTVFVGAFWRRQSVRYMKHIKEPNRSMHGRVSTLIIGSTVLPQIGMPDRVESINRPPSVGINTVGAALETPDRHLIRGRDHTCADRERLPVKRSGAFCPSAGWNWSFWNLEAKMPGTVGDLRWKNFSSVLSGTWVPGINRYRCGR
jgi:hypothetical protein